MGIGSGFQTLTGDLSGASSVLNQFTGLNADQWDIQEAAYGHPPGKLAKFLTFTMFGDFTGAVSRVQDSWSRRVIPFEFPYIDGQTTDDLGRAGESFDFDVLIFGPNYYQAYKALMKEFNDPRPGTLVHPVRGRMTVRPKSVTVTHANDSRQAVALRVTFLEHNFEVSFQDKKPSTKSALATAVAFISTIANLVNTIDSDLTVLSQVRQLIKGGMGQYQANYTQALVAINVSFNGGSSTDLPGLLPNNPGQTSTSFPSAETPNDPFSGTTPSDIVSQQSPTLAALQAQDLIVALRNQLTSLIETMEGASGGQGALIYYDQILALKQSSISIQSALELSLQSSNATIKEYTVPAGVVMSIREVCFANGISVDRSYELELLNPSISSLNYISAGTVLQVPSS